MVQHKCSASHHGTPCHTFTKDIKEQQGLSHLMFEANAFKAVLDGLEADSIHRHGSHIDWSTGVLAYIPGDMKDNNVAVIKVQF